MTTPSPPPLPQSTGDRVLPLRPHPPLARYYGSERERRQQVTHWFDQSAARYNFITQAMSFGCGHRYRRQALLRAGLTEGMSVLDVACGTGVLAAHAQRIVGNRDLVIGLDQSAGMLRQAREREVGRLVRGVADALPLAPGQFDLVCMGYALRHVADLRATFSEYRRMLNPGGTVLILEITLPRFRPSFHLLKFYLSRVIPVVAWIGGGRVAQELMEYYWDTIEHCIAPQLILESLEQTGFSNVTRHVELGIFSEYSGVR